MGADRHWEYMPFGSGEIRPLRFDDAELEAVATDDHVRFSVTEEKAMDSYNQTFTCNVNLPLDQARSLRDWLTEQIEGKAP